MTYSDIYKKFLIEYDKDAATTSYPSLTQTEVANILDKAYLAIIAQKLTGTNTRGVAFEGDVKAIEDIKPLLKTAIIDEVSTVDYTLAKNERVFKYTADKKDADEEDADDVNLLYYIQSEIIAPKGDITWPTVLVSHADALTFKETAHNHPWMDYPVVYLQEDGIHVLYGLDDFTSGMMDTSILQVTYIEKPTLFTTSLATWSTTNWQLSDTMAEEVINMAIILSLETIESARLSTKMSTSKLES